MMGPTRYMYIQIEHSKRRGKAKMKALFVETWKVVMDHQYNPLKYLDPASRYYYMLVLSWMWSMVFSLSFFSIFFFQYVWLAHLLLLTGVFITVTVFSNAERSSKPAEITASANSAARSVWDLEREA